MKTNSPHTKNSDIKSSQIANPHALALAVLSAFLATFSLPPFGFKVFAFLAWVPLFIIIHKGTMRQSFYFGMLQGFLYYGSTLIWFTRIFGLAAISLFAILAFFVALFCLIACALKWRMRHPLIDAMLMATLWTGIEYYRSEWFPLHFSWATPGVTVGPDWFTPYVGAYGVSFLIVFAGVLFSRIRDIPLWNQTFAVLVCILLYFPLPKKYPVNPVRVIAVQKEDAPLEDYITATRKWRFYHPEFVVWPEYAIPEDIRRVRTDEKKIMQMVRDMKTVLVFGTRTDTGNRLV